MSDAWAEWEPPEWVAARGPYLTIASEHFAVRLEAEGAELLVDGHRESTLGTLWALVAELAMPALAPAADLEREIGRARKAATT